MRAEICIIGAGPAGLTASIFAAEAGARTMVVEANTNPGRKLLLTGGGRCNLTHEAEPRQLVRGFDAKGRFLSYALYQFSPEKVRNFFAGLGLRTNLEKDGCVFPATDRAGDVRDTLMNRARKLGVTFLCGKRVGSITKETNTFVICAAKEQICSEKLIVATGGLSWPKTGCTGDGYRFARQFGHTIVEPRASLVPLVTRETWPGEIAGTAVEKVKISARLNSKKNNTSGAMVFTDDGIGGPAVLDMSRYLTDYLSAVGTPIVISLDLVPHFEQAALETRITERISANPKKKVTSVLAELVPRRLSAVLCKLADCDDKLEAGRLRKDVRKSLVQILKALPLSIMRTRPIAEATVTHGGVSVTEIESKTMESKICPSLFFAGEVLDVDGPCGGYNLQACWSTGSLAGTSSTRGVCV
jgi:predicted Rossmann fold flavoprotein